MDELKKFYRKIEENGYKAYWDSCCFHGIDEFLSEKLHIDTNV